MIRILVGRRHPPEGAVLLQHVHQAPRGHRAGRQVRHARQNRIRLGPDFRQLAAGVRQEAQGLLGPSARRQVLHQHQNPLGRLQPQRRQHHRHPRAVRAHILRLQRARGAQPAQRIHRLRARRGRLRRRQRIPPHLARLHLLASHARQAQKRVIGVQQPALRVGDQQRRQGHAQQPLQHVALRDTAPPGAGCWRAWGRVRLGCLRLHQGGRWGSIQCHFRNPPEGWLILLERWRVPEATPPQKTGMQAWHPPGPT